VADAPKQIEALELFNEKAEKLLGLSFVESLRTSASGVTIAIDHGGSGTITTERRGPSAEVIDAFVLTFRFFIQDNERCSLSNIAAVYEQADLSADLKKRFASARKTVNELLDSPNLVHASLFGVNPTNREIMDVFVYGGLAHANPDKRIRYRQWTARSTTAALLQSCLVCILALVLHGIDRIAGVNLEAIEELESAV